MKHIKLFEDIDNFMRDGGTEDEYLKSPDYFVETYINGQFSQLRKMLKMFRREHRASELLDYINNMVGEPTRSKIKDWIIEN